jgi:CRP-like cAMP-binding protein
MATVTALEDVDVIVINKACMAEILETNPSMAEQLSRRLERRLADTAEKMAALEKEAEGAVGGDIKSKHLLRRIRTFFHLK